ncbi:MAG: YdcF family protein [Clostridia bacterium]|nr:YdcF family protein [Clostridia bacterium]
MIGAISIVGINVYVHKVGNTFLTQTPRHVDAVIVPGASVRGNTVSAVLADRLNEAYRLYAEGYAGSIIVSGDHGTKDYNEVRAMRDYLVNKGVPAERIFMDHAGFSTYDTIYRAKEIFQVGTAIFVSQKLHVIRALYIAKQLNLTTWGISCGEYPEPENTIQKGREAVARVKAFMQCEILHPEPKFLGEPIPVAITNGLATED